jgi:uncharacterized protein with PIN domain
MIEALGVPHTEVALIVVDGEPTWLCPPFAGRRPGGGLSPVRGAGYGGAAALRDAPPLPLRFVADAHLGALARLLRMAGFDTLYRNDYADREVVELAVRDGRAVLSRDRDLLMRRGVVHGGYLRAVEPHAQFREVVGRFGLASQFRPFTRCMVCNAPLRAVAREDVVDRLPPSVQAKPLRLTACDACGRVYWEGSHWQRMRAMLAKTAAERSRIRSL